MTEAEQCGPRDAPSATTVLVVGAGLMGSQIACEYVIAGHDVTAVDPLTDLARGRVDELLVRYRDLGVFDVDTADRLSRGLRFLAPEQAIGPADVIVDALPEDLDLKTSTLRPFVAAAPAAIIASNTSSLSITALGEALAAGERTVGTHYWNPPLLMPLVEVIAGGDTTPAVIDRMVALLQGMGKQPVVVRRDVPGFLWNRLQFALLREAVWLAENDVSSPEDIDLVVREGLAKRWRLTGPFETAELGGAATFTAVAANLFPELSVATKGPDFIRWTADSPDRAAELRERRDRHLARELAAADPVTGA